MKKIISAIMCFLWLVSSSFSQSYNRMENPNYARTTFFEDFNNPTLDRNVWIPTIKTIKNGSKNYAPNLFIFIDSIATINQTNGSLCLSMLNYPNYRSTDWNGNTITANFIAGEVNTSRYFSYGVFECDATFANGYGSFPAFWTHSQRPCISSINNEMDIVELKINNTNSDFNYNTFLYSVPCLEGVGNGYNTFSATAGSHTFKGVWGPSKIEFWKDITKVGSISNTNQNWYPQYPMRIILSQQIWNYNNNSPGYGITTPQTSVFHWVRYKEFFLSPEITLSSNIICSSGNASMDVDPAATNISWVLTPSNLFSGASTGTGKIANITRATGANGIGKITYTFQMPITMAPYYESFTAEKEVWIGGPVIKSISGPLSTPNNQWATYHAELISGLSAATSYNWTLNPLNGNSLYYNGSSTIDIAFYNPGIYQLIVQAKNACTGAGYGPYFVTGLYVYQTYSLAISPNPTTSEATVELVSTSTEKNLKEPEWDLEIYDAMQSQKANLKKIKGTKQNINTSGWKDGIYIVRVKTENEVLSGRLVVKQ